MRSSQAGLEVGGPVGHSIAIAMGVGRRLLRCTKQLEGIQRGVCGNGGVVHDACATTARPGGLGRVGQAEGYYIVGGTLRALVEEKAVAADSRESGRTQRRKGGKKIQAHEPCAKEALKL